MPGAGHIRAANFVFSQAPKDGTVIATFIPVFVMAQVLDRSKGIQFDPANFNWLASTSSSNSTVYAWHTVGREVGRGRDQARGADGRNRRRLLHHHLSDHHEQRARDASSSSSPATRAPPRSAWRWSAARSKGRAGNNFNSLKAENAEWLATGKITLITQVGLERDPEFPDLPLMTDLAKIRRGPPGPEAVLDRRGDRPAVRDLAGRAGRAGGAAAQGVRRDDEGPGLSGGLRERRRST